MRLSAQLRYPLLFSLSILVWLSACTTTTEIESHWSAKEPPAGPYDNLFVLAVTSRGDIGHLVENSLATQLGARQVDQVVTARSQLSQDDLTGEGMRERVTDAVIASGAQAVLVATYLRSEEREEYIPPKTDQILIPDSPMFIGSGYRSYIGYHYDTVFTPGYFQPHREYYLQSSLYDVATGRLVWQAQSRTLNPPNLKSGIDSFTRALARRLSRDRVIGK